jgi:hypothetical protein
MVWSFRASVQGALMGGDALLVVVARKLNYKK